MDWLINQNIILVSFLGGFFTFLVTSLGALSVIICPKINEKILSVIIGFSAGVMLASAIYSLLNPAIELARELNYFLVFPVFIGLILGFAFLILIDYFLNLKNKRSNAMLLLTSMTIHNVPEGLCIGVAFGSIALGLDNLDYIQAISLTLAIGLQNFPEGMACALPLQNEGFSKKKSFIFGSMSAIVEPISAVIGAIIVIIVKTVLPYLLSFASIIMILVVINELLPEMIIKRKIPTSVGFILGFCVMLLLDICL